MTPAPPAPPAGAVPVPPVSAVHPPVADPDDRGRAVTGPVLHLLLALLWTAAAWVVVPGPVPDRTSVLAAAGGVLLLAALLLTRHRQPRIDDRDTDWILAVTAGAGALWTVHHWDTAGHPAAALAARVLVVIACLLLVTRTRATGWVWPAVLPTLVPVLPVSATWRTGLGWLALVGSLTAGLLLWRCRGAAPPDQLDVPGRRQLVAPAALISAVAVLARVGAA